jgi:hypothetical protein
MLRIGQPTLVLGLSSWLLMMLGAPAGAVPQ